MLLVPTAMLAKLAGGTGVLVWNRVLPGAIEGLVFGRMAANRRARTMNGSAAVPFEMFGISRKSALHI